jgi:hypothetical protein
MCVRLESQLASIERGIADPASSEQIHRYEEAVNRQQFELDRAVAQARRMGCEGSGFFLFGLGQAPQCDQLNGQIQRMRTNLDRVMADLQQLRSGPGNPEGQRRAILTALGQYNCGPQYRAAAAPPPPPQSSFWGSLFGGGANAPATDPNAMLAGSTYRTICVRTCDGFYFPVSYATTPAKFADDERACQRMCPAAEVALYSYRNPGEDVTQAMSVAGRPYTELPNAFRYRQEFNPSCSCRRAGESWAETLKSTNDGTVERGDIVVTEEKAKQLFQPKPEAPGQPAKQGARKAGAKMQSPTAEAPAAASAAPAAAASQSAAAAEPSLPPDAASPDTAAAATSPAKRNVRAVGPQFIPPR